MMNSNRTLRTVDYFSKLKLSKFDSEPALIDHAREEDLVSQLVKLNYTRKDKMNNYKKNNPT